MPKFLMVAIGILAYFTLSGAGCVPAYDTSDLVHPSARCMTAPASLQALKEGDDLVQSYASVSRQYGRETSKLRCVQRWARTVTEK
jgi:hypothetical protein